MPEPFDEYADQFTLSVGGYGATLTFMRTDRRPIAPGSAPQTSDIGTIRMSLEHLKVMAYLIQYQVKTAESGLGINVQVPPAILNNLQIAPEDWDQFWRNNV